MATIGLYIGTQADSTRQLFEKQPWEEYLSDQEVHAFGSSTLPEAASERFTVFNTTPRSPTGAFGKLVASIRDCQEYLSEQDPDILLQVMRYPTYAPGVSIVGRIHDVPVVSRYMGDDFNEFRIESGIKQVGMFALGNIIGRVPLLYSEKMIAFGPYSHRLLMKRGFEPRDIVWIPPTIDLPGRFHTNYNINKIRDEIGLPKNKRVILYTGRLTEKKGMEFMEDVISEFEEREDTLFVLLGEGPFADRFRSIYDSTTVRAPGYIDYEYIDMYYKAADLYVHPSPYEGIPLSILEATECGVPVIARRAGDIPFVISNIVDTPKEMAEEIDQPEKGPSLKNNEYLDIEKNRKKINKIVKEIISGYE